MRHSPTVSTLRGSALGKVSHHPRQSIISFLSPSLPFIPFIPSFPFYSHPSIRPSIHPSIHPSMHSSPHTYIPTYLHTCISILSSHNTDASSNQKICSRTLCHVIRHVYAAISTLSNPQASALCHIRNSHLFSSSAGRIAAIPHSLLPHRVAHR